MIVQFFVAMTPVGKARARVTRRGTYTPQKTLDAERLIGWACKKAMAGRKPLEGPVRLDWVAWFPIPKSWSKKKAELAIWHVVKPARDNIEKALADSLKGIAWVDDSQVCCGEPQKRYAWPGEQEPGLSIKIQEAAA